MEGQDSHCYTQKISELVTAIGNAETKKRCSRESSGGGNWKYQCEYCGIGYHTMGSVTSHRCRKHKTQKDKEFICFKCGQLFESSLNVMKHALIHQSETPFNCEKCGLNFINEKMLSRHVVGAHGTLYKETKLESSEVPQTSNAVPSTCTIEETKPVKSNNMIITPTVCNSLPEISPKKLTTATFGNWEFQCDYCGIGYHTMGSVTSHRSRKHKKIEDQLHKCYECKESFENAFAVKHHALIHQSDTPYVCKTCGLKFTSEPNLVKHTVGAHGAHREAARPVENISSPSMNNERSLNELLQLDNEPEKSDVPTPIIYIRKRKLNTKNSLKELFDQDRQARKRNSGISASDDNWPFQCDYCGRGYHASGSVSSHKWRIHEKQEDYKYRCFKCKQVFENSIEVMQHALIHLPDTPFECDICHFKFSSKIDLFKHKTNNHGIQQNRDKHFVANETCTLQMPTEEDEVTKRSEDMSQSESQHENINQIESDMAETSNAISSNIKRELLDQLELNWDCTMEDVQLGISLTNTKQTSTLVERTPIPLPVVIYQRAAQNTNEIMVIWMQELEIHTVTAICLNAAESLLCVKQNGDMFTYSDHMKKLINGNQPQSVNFTVVEDNDEATQWTLLSFGGRVLPLGIKNKLFKTYTVIETVLREYASIEQKNLVHVAQCTDKDNELISLLESQMVNTIIGCNYVDNK